MAGYIGNESATKEAIDSEGYFNTGDLGKLSHSGDIVITGRAKDTIVLSNGENIEPEPIEQHLIAKSSSLIDQAVVVGQDQRYLSALLVLSVPELVNRGLLSKQR
jgi:long-chain acyl-CoA synthetase